LPGVQIGRKKSSIRKEAPAKALVAQRKEERQNMAQPLCAFAGIRFFFALFETDPLLISQPYSMQAASVTREKRFAGSWAWLFPLTYLAHIAEEYWGGEGFPAWFSRLSGVDLTPARFLSLNRFALALMVVGVILALTVPPLRWLLISFGAVVLINALAHAVGSVWTRSYSPGLISGLLLWLPLGALTLRRAWILRSRRAFWSGVVVGVLLHGVITVLALSGGRA
jgi:hypothetical protein